MAVAKKVGEPAIMMSADKTVMLASSMVGASTLGLAMFLGDSMFKIDGMFPLTDAADDLIEYKKQYCWANLHHYDEKSGTTVSLYHYAYFPYIMFIFSVIFYVIYMTWKFKDLPNVLDYVLDGLEEQVKDVLQFLLEDIKSHQKNQENGQIKRNSESPSVNTISSDNQTLLKRKSKSLNPNEEILLQRKLKDKQTKKGHVAKYKYFHYLLEKYSCSRRHVWKIIQRRMSVYLLLLLVNIYICYQFLMPIRNPTEINCPLPPHLRQNESVHETIKFIFTPVTIRTSLMWFTVICYVAISLFATGLWFRTKKNNGVRLLRNIGSKQVQQILEKQESTIKKNAFHKNQSGILVRLNKYISPGFVNTDLDLLMELVVVNQHRLQYIEVAFNTLFASEDLEDQSESDEEVTNFMSVLREAMFWQIDGSEFDNEIKDIIEGLNENLA